MAVLPAGTIEAWERRDGAPVFTTVDAVGNPNSVYATCIRILDDHTMVVADNYFDKTKKNLFANAQGSILFITDEKKAFQIKGELSYHKEGPVFDFMKSWNPDHLPGHAAVALAVTEVYTGAEKLA